MDKQADFVLRTIEERDIRFVRLWFTDVIGSLKSVAVAPAELEAAIEVIVKNELQAIVTLGGVLGFVVGLLQVGFLFLSQSM